MEEINMKEIKALILKEFLERTVEKLMDAGALDITVNKVEAIGKLADYDEDRTHIIRKYQEQYSSLRKLEIVCADDEVDRFVDIIKCNCCTGAESDGRIFVYDVLRAVNIKTGEEGKGAL